MVHKGDERSNKGRDIGLLPPTPEELATLAQQARKLVPGTTKREVRPRREWTLRRRFSQEMIASLVTRYNDGASIAALSRELGVSDTSFRKLLLGEGVTLRRWKRGPLSQQEVSRAVRRYESGRTIREVAAELGSSYTTIRMLLHEQSVVMREDAIAKDGESATGT